MFCKKCGSEIPDGSHFCRKCGTSVEGGETAAQTKRQSQIAVPASNATSSEKPRSTKGRGATPMIIGVVAVALVALIAFGVINSNNGNGSNTAADNRNGAQAVPEQQAPAQPTNFEEWLSANNPNFPDTIRNIALRESTFGVLDCSVQVSGNQVSIIDYLDISSDELGTLGRLGANMLNEALYEDQIKANVDLVKSWEQQSGMAPIYLHIEDRFKDGPVLRSFDFTSEGQL